jgi:hypothetical protein
MADGSAVGGTSVEGGTLGAGAAHAAISRIRRRGSFLGFIVDRGF